MLPILIAFPLYKEEVGYDSNTLSTDAHALLIRQQVGSQGLAEPYVLSKSQG